MTGEHLRDQLVRIAESAPDLHVDHDLFDRGRRATARARRLAGAATVVCLVLAAGIVWQVSRPGEAPVADGGSRVGVPDRVYEPPGEGSPLDLPLSPLEQVGQAAVAYVADEIRGEVVVVTSTGEYLAVRLPGLVEPVRAEVRLLLSPDGRRLAWATHTGTTRGLSIADLGTGEIRDVDLGRDAGVSVSWMQWSPDGRWLTWSGRVVTSLEGDAASFGLATSGVVAPDATTSKPLPPSLLPLSPGDPAPWDGAGVCADGTAVQFIWPTFKVSAAQILHESWSGVVAAHEDCSAPRSLVGAEYAEYGQRRLLGWLEDSAGDGGDEPTAVVLVPDHPDDSSHERSSLQLSVSDGSPRTVGTVESSWVTDVTVATGLMTADRPTVPAGPSPWARSPWAERRSELVAAGALVTALVLLGTWLRRRRRPAS